MQKGKFFRIVFVIPTLIFLFCLLVAGNFGGADDSVGSNNGKFGLITIKRLQELGSLERAPVIFPHDHHTDILAKSEGDCKECHLKKDDGSFSFKFKRLEELSRVELMNVYHTECIGCHDRLNSMDNSDSSKTFKPITCGKCHIKELKDFKSSQKLINFNKHLHLTHVKINEEKCEACHHEYNNKEEKLVYIKGKENPCSYCHMRRENLNGIEIKSSNLEKTDLNMNVSILSMKEASHYYCLKCHLTKKARALDAGPIKCEGCHDLSILSSIKKHEKIPRLERGQPDVAFVNFLKKDKQVKKVIISNNSNNVDKLTSSRLPSMNLVPFNHQFHEISVDRCVDCHHASLDACNNCHFNASYSEVVKDVGKGEVGEVIESIGINLVNSMHSKSSNSSCVGCHQRKVIEKECIGCHKDSLVGSENSFGSSCQGCHIFSINSESELFELFRDIDKKNEIEDVVSVDRLELLNDYFSKIKEGSIYNNLDKLPEEVTIDVLKNEYKSVVMPHKKIISSLYDGIKNSRLASVFHDNEGVLCSGCHHNAPMSSRPANCISCHDPEIKIDVSTSFKPDLLSAYHQQCMWCHDSMALEKPVSRDCKACHEKVSSDLKR